jgi:peptidoglycan/xylan/chitin deacetylase (PgdA/CDA1 family)
MKRFIPSFAQVRNVALLAALFAVIAVWFVPFHSGPLSAVTQQECSLGRFIDHTYKNGTVVPPDAAGGATGTTVAKASFSVPSASTNLITNPSIEQVSGSQPQSWLSNVYGDNNAAFSLSSDAHTGKYSLSTTISQFKSGDADWYYLPVPVTGGEYYQYDDFYKSNVSTPLILESVDASGNTTYINLTGAAAAKKWTHYSVRFFVPDDAVKVTVFHALTQKGFLNVDDVSLAPATLEGFSSGMVSLTFDDGWKGTYQNAFPLLEQNDIVSTQYLISGYLDAPAYMTVSDALKMQRAGNEIASHTVNHLDLTSQTQAVASHELTLSKKDLTNCFGDISDFAPPYGTYNPSTTAMVQQNYSSQRSTEVGFNTADSFNPYDIKVQNISNATTEAQLADWLETAKADHTWLVLVYHDVDDSGGQYDRSISEFKADIETIKQSNIPTLTMSQALSNISSQTKK